MRQVLIDTEPNLQYLISEGYREKDLRRHSPDWIRTTGENLQKKLSGDKAVDLMIGFVGYTAGKYGGEAHEAMMDLFNTLSGNEDEVGFFTDPTVRTDINVLRQELAQGGMKLIEETEDGKS